MEVWPQRQAAEATSSTAAAAVALGGAAWGCGEGEMLTGGGDADTRQRRGQQREGVSKA